MKWIIVIIWVIIISWLYRIFQNNIDRKERRGSLSTSNNSITLWDGLCFRFGRYLDFSQKSLMSDRMEIANQKGETFIFQKAITDIIVFYKLNGKVEKTWKFPFWVAIDTAFNNIDEFYREDLQPKASTKHVSKEWIVTSSRPFTEEEIMAVKSNRVVKSQYGLSVEFTMKKGGVTYIPLCSKNENLIGVEINLNVAEIFTLSKEGEKDIYRIEHLPY